MKTVFKIIAGIIGAFIIMGVLFAGCTAFVFNEADIFKMKNYLIGILRG